MSRSSIYTDTLTRTPQSEKVPGREQVENYAGGQVFELDKWDVLDRFLILGTESPTYYASARKITLEALDRVLACIKEDPPRVVARAVEISHAGRAPSNSPAIFVLALVAARADHQDDKNIAYESMPKVCRIGTHLFEFIEAIHALKGTLAGSGLRRALRRWYTEKKPGDLAYQLLKYRQRGGWTHRDVLRVAKPVGDNAGEMAANDINKILSHATGHPERHGLYSDDGTIVLDDEKARRLFTGYEALRGAEAIDAKPRIIAELVQEYQLTREMVPVGALAHKEVWRALLPGMPLGALLRNLGKLTSVGVLRPLSSEAVDVAARFLNVEAIRKARLHPAVILNAYKIYAQGHGQRGSLGWQPTQEVMSALDRAFSLGFDALESTGKRFYLGIDVSGSMSGGSCAGLEALTPVEGAAAMAMAIARVEPRHAILGFASARGQLHYGNWRDRGNTAMRDLGIIASDSMPSVLAKIRAHTMGATDCALPMLDAIERGLEVDCFVILTDNETWYGDIHPFQALRQYRRKSGINARLVVVGMTGTPFTIADPNDAGMLDVVGFDAAAPGIIQKFAAGTI